MRPTAALSGAQRIVRSLIHLTHKTRSVTHRRCALGLGGRCGFSASRRGPRRGVKNKLYAATAHARLLVAPASPCGSDLKSSVVAAQNEALCEGSSETRSHDLMRRRCSTTPTTHTTHPLAVLSLAKPHAAQQSSEISRRAGATRDRRSPQPDRLARRESPAQHAPADRRGSVGRGIQQRRVHVVCRAL